jgi:hypothetical protein
MGGRSVQGHCHLKGHLFKLGLTDNRTCEQCLEKDESPTHTSYVTVRLYLIKILSPGSVFYGTK